MMMLFDHPQAGPSPMPATATAMEGHPHPHPHAFAHDAPTGRYTAAVNQQPLAPSPPDHGQPSQPQQRLRRKRKADAQDAHNERLSKRMSLLNLEHNGPKLYVPVEQTYVPQQTPVQTASIATTPADSSAAAVAAEEPMHLDDTSHKVYIYNLDDELTSESESEPEDRDREGKLVFLPDIEKHLRANRLPLLPRPILPNKDGELAGMQLVLYSDGPSSLSVPEEQDGVRKAILEARARVRQRQAEEREAGAGRANAAAAKNNANVNRKEKMSFATPVRVSRSEDAFVDMMVDGQTMGQSTARAAGAATEEYDPDAMDID